MRSRPGDRSSCASAFAAAPVGGATEVTQPSGNQLDFLVAVQCGIECDVVSAGIEVTQGQAREWLEPSSAEGLLDIEIDFPAVYLIPDRVQRQTWFVDLRDQSGAHPPNAAVEAKRHKTGES